MQGLPTMPFLFPLYKIRILFITGESYAGILLLLNMITYPSQSKPDK